MKDLKIKKFVYLLVVSLVFFALTVYLLVGVKLSPNMYKLVSMIVMYEPFAMAFVFGVMTMPKH